MMFLAIQNDNESDAMYIKLSSAPIVDSLELDDNRVIDLDIEGNVVGIDLLAISTGTSITWKEITDEIAERA
jgi:uncharacterized protein YuzE